MNDKVITKSVVFIEYDGDELHLTNQVTSTYATGPEGECTKVYKHVYECALDYAQAISNLIESKMRKDRNFKITVEYRKPYPK